MRLLITLFWVNVIVVVLIIVKKGGWK